MLSFGSSVKKMAEEAPSLNLSFFLFFFPSFVFCLFRALPTAYGGSTG